MFRNTSGIGYEATKPSLFDLVVVLVSPAHVGDRAGIHEANLQRLADLLRCFGLRTRLCLREQTREHDCANPRTHPCLLANSRFSAFSAMSRATGSPSQEREAS